MSMKIITVQAQPGRTFPLDAGANPVGGFRLINPGDQADVYLTSEIRRGLRDGDLVDMTPKPVAVPSPLPAIPSTSSAK